MSISEKAIAYSQLPKATLYTKQSLERTDKGSRAFTLYTLHQTSGFAAQVTFEILKLPHIRENYS